MKKSVFSVKKLIIFILVFIVIVFGLLMGSYFFLISPTSKKSMEVRINVSEGQSYSTISSILKKNKLIRNEVAYKIYLKLNNPSNSLEAGDYILNTNNSVKQIISTLQKGSISVASTKSVTFVEGKNMRYIISTIVNNFDIKEEDILSKLSDEEYLNDIISDYWFLTDKIKNKDLYYSLEGYLYPDTYEFYTSASIEDIFAKMLNNMDKKLEAYKEEIENSKYDIHQMITLASIIELEAGSSSDRKGVAGVFYNRLNNGWSLGSDVTTYYAEKIDNFSRDLKLSELKKCNNYNTRSSCMIARLPIGPICNPGINSIIASIEPTKHNYYYFVADKNGKTYFNKTDSEHTKTVSKLKREGLWIEYEN